MAAVHRALLFVAELAAQAPYSASAQRGDGEPTATFRDDEKRRVPEQWATRRPGTAAGEPT
ncbi:hypothetical protein [Streptomyces sp. MZ04]|uniref:hypothetical protein n=1 Tax=Streptomyces sp. MZ04 TaxID=2559236 RepID=UPI00107EADF0|nr:hypothetical protein [Streptomyces sp. MZ04]TGB15538.1 hypothetical protein E2651_02665 [Streptomyces sp. MZ04]